MTVFIIIVCMTGIISAYGLNRLLIAEENLNTGYDSSIKLISYMEKFHNDFIYNNEKAESYYVNRFADIVVDNDNSLHAIIDKSVIIGSLAIKDSKTDESND